MEVVCAGTLSEKCPVNSRVWFSASSLLGLTPAPIGKEQDAASRTDGLGGKSSAGRSPLDRDDGHLSAADRCISASLAGKTGTACMGAKYEVASFTGDLSGKFNACVPMISKVARPLRVGAMLGEGGVRLRLEDSGRGAMGLREVRLLRKLDGCSELGWTGEAGWSAMWAVRMSVVLAKVGV